MRMYHPVYLKLLREACTRHGVHLIADEIATGFGRSGRMFAWDWVDGGAASATDGSGPDFICLSKGLTGGTMALACVLTSETVYQAFYDDYASYRAFLHSHSYTGNPIACAAALATLEVFASRDWMAQNRRSSMLMWNATADLRSHPRVAEVRQQGMVLAVELVRNARTREPYPAAERRGLRVYRHGLECGVLLRPLGNVLYLMPPYVINDEEIVQVCQTLVEGVEQATG
jgi:adenosylmethionine-8-amino-7-oxononanoate aminotransferase